jgi:hypothetical protein
MFLYYYDFSVRSIKTLRHHEYMRERFNNYTRTRPLLKKSAGWFLVVFGFIMLVTPLTPGGILFFVGLEILGFRAISFNTLRDIFSRTKRIPQTLEAELEQV